MDVVAFWFVAASEGERRVAGDTQYGSENYNGQTISAPQIRARTFVQQNVLLADAVRQCEQHAKENTARREARKKYQSIFNSFGFLKQTVNKKSLF